MLSIYFLCLCIFPVTVLAEIKLLNRSSQTSLISKEDTGVLRGVSACCVVIAHFIRWVNEIQAGMNTVFYVLVSQLGGIGVLVFFFVSGYGIYESYSGKHANNDFLWKRAKSVYFPYIIIKALFLIAYVVMDEPPDIRSWTVMSIRLISILLAEDWFIHVILIQYIAFFLIWKFAKKNRIIVYSFLLDFVISLVFMAEGRQGSWLNALWLFTFGMACSRYKKQITIFFSKRIWIKVFLLFMAFGMFGCMFALNKDVGLANIFKPISGGALCLGICGMLRKVTFSSRIMTYLGKRSMHLYIVHMNIWDLLIGMSNAIQRFWSALVLSLVITEVMYRITEFLIQRGYDPKLQSMYVDKHIT